MTGTASSHNDQSASTAHTGRRILLAEDHDDARKAVAFRLKLMGLDVTTAADGSEACRLALEADAQGTPFDWILMDMEMPVLDGYEATRRLRDQGYRGVIIAMTAHSFEQARDECVRIGCDAQISKPIDWDNLASILDGKRPA
jgi:two-component system, sensor histidine kinase